MFPLKKKSYLLNSLRWHQIQTQPLGEVSGPGYFKSTGQATAAAAEIPSAAVGGLLPYRLR